VQRCCVRDEVRFLHVIVFIWWLFGGGVEAFPVLSRLALFAGRFMHCATIHEMVGEIAQAVT